jgi:alanine racemase
MDTGMNRLGFVEEDTEKLIDDLKANPLIYVQSVFSHLAASDKPEFDDFTRDQIEKFRRIGDRFIDRFDQEIYLHILNSAGIHRFPEATFNMVRLGIGLYGISPAKEDKGKLKQISTMRSEIAQIKSIGRGDSVSYNRSFVAPKEMRIGVVSAGYADGLMRSLGNGKLSLIVKGTEVPIIGDVCMDMCMIDLTGTDAREGDEVIIFNEEYPVTRLSKAAGTIPYEILSRISRRVKRVYYHE